MNQTAAPAVTPFDTRMLQVGDGHRLYVEQVGDPAGTPALFLHGGPGSGCQPFHRGLFDPAQFRAILFDQRGAGRSRPKGGLAANTTRHLVADMERIRRALGIERWMLVGGSWGSLLAVAYAEVHRDRVSGLVLRGVFLGSAQEIDWAFTRGPRTLFPELWRAFADLLPKAERGDPIAAYGARLTNPDPAVHVPAARAWQRFERALSVLRPNGALLPTSLEEARRAPGIAPTTPYMEWHYISQDCFLEAGELLDGVERLAGLPGIIVQGRYDLLCPPVTADALAARWPDCDLRLVEGAGHDLSEPGVRPAIIAAIDEMAGRTA